jgi:hypothetical protein
LVDGTVENEIHEDAVRYTPYTEELEVEVLG